MASSWRDNVAAVISLAENNPQTVILHGVSPEIVDLKEQELLNCLHHVSSVLHYGNVVLGAGQSEEKCREFLNERLEMLRRDEHSVTNIDLQYMQVVTESVMSSFQEYSRLFQGNFSGKVCAFEGYKSKIESWKLALETVAIITNIDTYIETGITDEQTNIGTL
ncbi:uncharacterized protein LOC132749978 [Ruditapes philippinarum]|uniref:uncharacterized protein LOC132749978 n=1 Tax=Ruditapes philippinarum TaxID=129788 RepID=UPI00295B45B6|nr:uncharacterized protein LOC132749978 [Ruditapes philippinarum]